jgi:hypothetical protein
MRSILAALLLAFLSGSVSESFGQYFRWHETAVAIPDEHTEIMVSLAIFQGQMKQNWGDPNELAKRLHEFRYRLSDLKHDPSGDAWFIEPSEKERADFNRQCTSCVGGDLYTMALSAHDGKVLEFYFPQ